MERPSRTADSTTICCNTIGITPKRSVHYVSQQLSVMSKTQTPPPARSWLVPENWTRFLGHRDLEQSIGLRSGTCVSSRQLGVPSSDF